MRIELLRALVRSHQELIEARVRLTRTGEPFDPQLERDLATITERIMQLLGDREEPTRGGDPCSSS